MERKSTSSSHVYKQLRNEIVFLQLVPGQSISETETGERFNVSRTPVRDAFKHLEVEGLLNVKRGHGSFVSLIDIDEIEDIIYIREKLETSVVKEIKRVSQSEKNKLNDLLKNQRQLLDSNLDYEIISRKFVEADNKLHAELFNLANRENIWKRIANDRPHYNRLRVLTNLYNKNELKKLYKEHEEIVGSIIKQDYKEIDNYYHNHIYRGMSNLSKIIEQYNDYFIKPYSLGIG